MTTKQQYTEQYTNAFLLDKNVPTRVVLLRRARDKKFAPNMYTGIGGKIEANETAIEAAYRELEEETGIINHQLREFSRCVIPEYKKIIHYYWTVYSESQLPDCNEGDLEWITADKLTTKEIIPVTRMVLEEWQKRNFATNKNFTLYAKVTGSRDDWNSGRELDYISEGLLNN